VYHPSANRHSTARTHTHASAPTSSARHWLRRHGHRRLAPRRLAEARRHDQGAKPQWKQIACLCFTHGQQAADQDAHEGQGKCDRQLQWAAQHPEQCGQHQRGQQDAVQPVVRLEPAKQAGTVLLQARLVEIGLVAQRCKLAGLEGHTGDAHERLLGKIGQHRRPCKLALRRRWQRPQHGITEHLAIQPGCAGIGRYQRKGSQTRQVGRLAIVGQHVRVLEPGHATGIGQRARQQSARQAALQRPMAAQQQHGTGQGGQCHQPQLALHLQQQHRNRQSHAIDQAAAHALRLPKPAHQQPEQQGDEEQAPEVVGRNAQRKHRFGAADPEHGKHLRGPRTERAARLVPAHQHHEQQQAPLSSGTRLARCPHR
jgi:hypothetical protein